MKQMIWAITISGPLASDKADAEIRGGYNNIEGGFPEEGFALLMNKSADDFSRINLDDKGTLDTLKKRLIVCGLLGRGKERSFNR